jgi:CheY-like chemotaxis protein
MMAPRSFAGGIHPLEAVSHRRRMLLIEDNALVADTISLMVEDHFETVTFGLGKDGLAFLGSGPTPDVVLLDCLLPDGLPRAVVASAQARGIPVVLTSGDPDAPRLLHAGLPSLPKPFHQSDLLKVLYAAV